MQQFDSTDSTVLVLRRSEELHEQLKTYALAHDFKAAWLTGLGGAMRATLGYYNFDTQEYQWRDFDDNLEILSLVGNMSIVDGKPFWHVHGTFSGPEYQVIGGHVKSLVIGLTGELHITALDAGMTRQHDDETGLKLLCPLAN